MSDLVTRTDRDGLCTLTLNRPDKLNALNVRMFVQLRAHVDQIAKQTESVGCGALRGHPQPVGAHTHRGDEPAPAAPRRSGEGEGDDADGARLYRRGGDGHG